MSKKIVLHISAAKDRILLLMLSSMFVGLAGSGCTSQPPQIAIEGQYANLSPMFFGVGSLFMKINNAGGRDALVSATVNVPDATVEVHDVKDGKMVKIERMKVPSRSTLELKPR